MPLRPPNLDDRRFQDLLEEARRQIVRSCPAWTDLSPGDPGMTLIEVFAHLTEVMIYRLNLLPEKAYVEFLRLIGVKLQPPSAAVATLRFTLGRAQERAVEIPRGTRVTSARAGPGAEPPVFLTAETVSFEPGATAVEVSAYHCDLVDGELIGAGTGLAGLSLIVTRPPIIAPTRDGLDLVVGVETEPQELDLSARAIHHEGKAFRVWREVDNFTDLGPDPFVYVTDRLAGTITFAPAVRRRIEEGNLEEVPTALAAIPPAGREIRAWYRRGGGAAGNVAAEVLTILKDPLPGVAVTNSASAVGGRAAESLENALLRGPHEIHSLRRAVTARDFELVAMRSSGAVDRTHAFTKAELWSYAAPGTVEVRVVPHVPEAARGDRPVTAETLHAHETESARQAIQSALDRRKPIGTNCLVGWARYKPVHVSARIVIGREEAPAAVRLRVLRRLYDTITPLSASAEGPGWAFGEPLTAWHVYKIASSEPGVRSVSNVRLLVDEVPGSAVRALSSDAFQPRTWYAASGETLFRSMNDAEGWEPAGRFPGEQIAIVRAYPREASQRPGRAGLVAVATHLPEAGSRLYFSRDCGETWAAGPETRFRVEDMAWLERDDDAALMLATELGLYELATAPGAVPIQVLVDPDDQNLGFVAVAVSTDVWGGTSVAVAAREERGVYLSSQAGRPKTFTSIGLEGELARILAVQHLGPHRYLWAGIGAPGTLAGKGCFRWRLTGAEESPEGWRGYHDGWNAGGCRSLAFQGAKVFAASHRRGVLRLDTEAREPNWEAPDVNCGLPLRDMSRLKPVDVVAADPEGRLLLAGGEDGVYRSADHGTRFVHCSSASFSDQVTLPRTWLFCSGDHDIRVVTEDEADRD